MSFKGALGGAGTGASIGSIGGPWGAAIGGAAGGAMGLLGMFDEKGGSGVWQDVNKRVAPESPEEKKLKEDLFKGTQQNVGFSGIDLFKEYLAKARQGDFSGLPTESDVSQAQSLINKIYASREAGLKLDARNQMTNSNQLAASLGRSVNDPVIQAKLRQSVMDQQSLLEAQKISDTAKLSQQMPQQRLGILGNLLSLQQGAESRQQDTRMQLLQSLQNFRLGAAGTAMTGSGAGNTGADPLTSALTMGTGALKLFSASKGLSGSSGGGASDSWAFA